MLPTIHPPFWLVPLKCSTDDCYQWLTTHFIHWLPHVSRHSRTQVAEAAAAPMPAASQNTDAALSEVQQKIEEAEGRWEAQQEVLTVLQIDMAEALQAIQEHNVKLRDQVGW